MSIRFIEGSEEFLERVSPLWAKLNAHHTGLSSFFQDEIRKRTFDQRVAPWVAKAKLGLLRVGLAFKESQGEAAKDVGYCVSIIHEDCGEIDSIYENAVVRRRLNVAVGNERVLGFYRKYGFYPRAIVLEQRD